MTANKFRHGFTLIEIMVAIGIIVILGTIMVAVGGNVRKSAQIKGARADLKALEGIAEIYERESGQKLPSTVYAKTPDWKNIKDPSGVDFPPGTNAITVLMRHPETKPTIEKFGSKVVKSDDAVAANVIYFFRDQWGTPVHFMQAGTTVSGTTATRTHFRSSGPDGLSDFANPGSAVNNDDIYSYEAAN